ncbi:LysR family transcriptional regulator [Pseudohalocynthiibacter aestuariivivens]|uniref:LysR family transcriptional regulator n=1 Tax=Pseudohalocynthiibacter aestuariivivens TaxID=1591409 RepID=A0ABV5JCX2_9RHOB|nr:LysR family transcriptional regulator [Pseudohalocynthiibacter aestuariivivens]
MARHQSFTRAAEELNVQQPAISRQMNALEEELNAALFVRLSATISSDHRYLLTSCVVSL